MATRSLMVTLKANVLPFSKEILKASNITNTLSGHFGLLGKAAKTVGDVINKSLTPTAAILTGIGLATAGVTAAFAAGVIAAKRFSSAIHEQFQELDKLAKLSARTGMNAGFVRGISRQAELSGVSPTALPPALSRMNRVIGDALLLKGDKTLTDIGLDPKVLAGLSQEERFLSVADAISGQNDPSKRSAAAMSIFGKSGEQLLPMLEGGSANLRLAVQETSKLMGGLDETKLAKIQEFNDAITDLGLAFKGLKQVIAQDLSPALSDLAISVRAFAHYLPMIGGAASSLAGGGVKTASMMGGGQVVPSLLSGLFGGIGWFANKERQRTKQTSAMLQISDRVNRYESRMAVSNRAKEIDDNAKWAAEVSRQADLGAMSERMLEEGMFQKQREFLYPIGKSVMSQLGRAVGLNMSALGYSASGILRGMSGGLMSPAAGGAGYRPLGAYMKGSQETQSLLNAIKYGGTQSEEKKQTSLQEKMAGFLSTIAGEVAKGTFMTVNSLGFN